MGEHRDEHFHFKSIVVITLIFIYVELAVITGMLSKILKHFGV